MTPWLPNVCHRIYGPLQDRSPARFDASTLDNKIVSGKRYCMNGAGEYFFRRSRKDISRSLEIELFDSQPYGFGYFFKAGPAWLGAVLHLGEGSLGHVRPCCNLGLGESKVLAPCTHRRPIVSEGKIHSFVGDKNSCTCDWSRPSLPGNRATSQGIDGRTDHGIVLPINLVQLLQGFSMPFHGIHT